MAIAYVMHKTPNVFPIIGGRKVEHLKANIEALDVSLSKEQIEYLDGAVPFDPGFPTTMIVSFVFFPFSSVDLTELCVGRRNELFFPPLVGREDGEAAGLATYQALIKCYFETNECFWFSHRYTRHTIHVNTHIHPAWYFRVACISIWI